MLKTENFKEINKNDLIHLLVILMIRNFLKTTWPINEGHKNYNFLKNSTRVSPIN